MKLEQILNEKVVTFGLKTFPKFGHFVAMAGGPGVGKGFVLQNIVPIEGKQFSPDDIGETFVATGKLTKEQWADGDFLEDYYKEVIHPLNDKKISQFFNLLVNSKSGRRPNIIVDSSGRRLRERFIQFFPLLKSLGYETTLVYVSAERDVAWQRALGRDRQISRKVFDEIHGDVPAAVKEVESEFDNVWYINSSSKESNWWVKYPELIKKQK